jgi:CDP-diacylglycerol---glycerol-3-phosphate 3-phosphatidyltransferase
MLSRYAKAFFNRLLTPPARLLLAMGIGPDIVTWIGTIGVVAGAFAFYPRGEFFVGTVVITAFVFSDTLDGTMARLSGRSSRWGAFLDSTLDRIGDAAIFTALLWWFVRDDQPWLAAVTAVCLIGGMVVSYAKARAEGLGMTCNVGIAERSERLVTALVTTGLAGLFHAPWLQAAGLTVLAAATLVTVVQRLVHVHQQASAADLPPGAKP